MSTTTPRTDEAAYRVWGIENVNASLARTLETELTAANARIAELEKDQSPRFHVPTALLEDYRRYITELPPCEIVADGILVSKDVLIELVNALKNGMTKDLNTALVANKEMEAQLASAREDGEKLESQRDEALSTLQHIADRKDSMGVTVLYLGSVAKTTADRLRSAIDSARGVTCKTCKGYGFIPWTRGQTPESFEQGEDPCPDCAGRTSPPASAEPGAAPTHRWSYSSYKATLYCDGKPWAIVSPDGRNALSAADASLLELAMNSMTLPPPTQDGKERERERMIRHTMIAMPLASIAATVFHAQEEPETVQDVHAIIVGPVPPTGEVESKAISRARYELSAWTADTEGTACLKVEDKRRPAYRRQNNEPFYMSVPKRKRGRK